MRTTLRNASSSDSLSPTMPWDNAMDRIRLSSLRCTSSVDSMSVNVACRPSLKAESALSNRYRAPASSTRHRALMGQACHAGFVRDYAESCILQLSDYG